MLWDNFLPDRRLKIKRRGRDSNPGCRFRHNCLAGSCLQPLGHLSGRQFGVGSLEFGESLPHLQTDMITYYIKRKTSKSKFFFILLNLEYNLIWLILSISEMGGDPKNLGFAKLNQFHPCTISHKLLLFQHKYILLPAHLLEYLWSYRNADLSKMRFLEQKHVGG